MSASSKLIREKKVKPPFDTFLFLTLAVTLLVFAKGMNSDILNFDDDEYFRNYPEILRLNLKNIGQYFSSYYVMMYQPLPVFSFALTLSLFKFNLIAHHGINLVLHLFNVYLVYKLTGRLNKQPLVARIVAFLFALHPLAVEPVMWISCRSSGMYVLFYLLGLTTYVKYRDSGDKKALWLCGGWFLLSLFSKAQAVTFPLALMALDLFHYKIGLTRKNLPEKIPFFLLSLIFGIAAILNADTTQNIAYTASQYSIIDTIFMLSYECAWYLFKVILPLNLSPIYVYPVKNGALLPVVYYLSLIAFLALGWLVIKNRKKRPYLVFGFAFFYAVISVALQIVPSRLFIVADRYGYLPNLGIYYGLACFWAEENKGWLAGLKSRVWILYGAGAVLVLLSFRQTEIWKNDLNLATRIIEVNPETEYIARAYGIRGNYQKNIVRNNQEALNDYQKAAQLDSSDMISRYQTALIYQSMGDTSGAIRFFRQAYRANPVSPMPYTDMGVLFSSAGQFNRALLCADTALQKAPHFPNALVLKAVCLLNLGKPIEAEKVLTECIRYNPNFMEAWKNRGIIRINDLHNNTAACSDFKKAADLGDAESVQILADYCR